MENQNTNILTDEQVEDINNSLEEAKAEENKKLEEIINATPEEKIKMLSFDDDGDDNYDYPYNAPVNKNIIKAEALVEVDPVTGEKKILPDQSGLHSDLLEDISLEDLATEDSGDLKLAELTEESMKKSLIDMDMSDEEAIQIINILKKDENGFEVKYEDLPHSLQMMVNSLRGLPNDGGAKRSTKTVIKDVLGYFRTQLQMDQEIINFQEVLQKEMKIPSMFSMYNEETDKLMSEKIIELADKVETEQPEKAKLLREISAAYEDAKNFTTIARIVNNNEKPAKRIDREVKRFNKYIRDFNFKYNNNTKFTIDSLQNTLAILIRKTGCTEEQAKKFLIIFCRICLNKKSNDVVDHTYMYYTLKTITTLDAFNEDDKVYIKNIEQLCNILDKLK